MMTPHLMINGQWVPLSKCEFINIEEDLHGRDRYTVKYRGKIYESLCVLRYEQ